MPSIRFCHAALELLLTLIMVTYLSLSYAAAIDQETKSSARAPWCARGERCAALILGPSHGVVQVPLEKLRWDGVRGGTGDWDISQRAGLVACGNVYGASGVVWLLGVREIGKTGHMCRRPEWGP